MTRLRPFRLTARWCGLRKRLPSQVALAWLLLALVAVPLLGRLHQVGHGAELEQLRAGHTQPGAAQAGAQHGFFVPSLTAQGAGAEHSHGLHGLLELLLAQHAPVDCLVLDQLALGDALDSARPVLPALSVGPTTVALQGGRFSAPHIALFQARGPPTA